MRNSNRRLISSIVEILVGGALFVCSLTGVLKDQYWGSCGVTLMTIGAIFLVRQIRYRSDADYKEKLDIREGDERNRYIAMKAWAWAGYLFVITAGVGTIAFKIAQKNTQSLMCGFAVSLIILLYWICYMVLQKKE